MERVVVTTSYYEPGPIAAKVGRMPYMQIKFAHESGAFHMGRDKIWELLIAPDLYKRKGACKLSDFLRVWGNSAYKSQLTDSIFPPGSDARTTLDRDFEFLIRNQFEGVGIGGLEEYSPGGGVVFYLRHKSNPSIEACSDYVNQVVSYLIQKIDIVEARLFAKYGERRIISGGSKSEELMEARISLIEKYYNPNKISVL